MADQLEAAKREIKGKRRIRRMRAGGQVPATLYGHGEETVSIAVPTDQINAVIRHGSQMVDLTGELSESALIREIQWDTFGTEVLHVDFARVDKMEKVDVTVQLEIRGVAPGTREGGIVQQPIHVLEISCPASTIPESIEVNINHLDLECSIQASELELPEGATLITPEDQIVVQCSEPSPESESEESASSEGIEPEVIGRADAEEGEGES